MDHRLEYIKRMVRSVRDEDLIGLPYHPQLSGPFFQEPDLCEYFGLSPTFPGARAHYVASKLHDQGITLSVVYRAMEEDKKLKKPLF